MRILTTPCLIALVSLPVFWDCRVPVFAQEAEAGQAAAPEFKTEKAKKAFESAQALFAEGKYKEASREFKSALRGAKSKEDKAVVDSWVDACDGARYVEQVKMIIKQQKLQLAHQYAAKIQSKCRGNPSEALFEKTVKELEDQLFLMLENFDYRDNRYSAKYGKTFINDPSIVIRGKQCLRWVNTRDLNRYDAIEFWANYRIPPAAEVVISCGPAKADPKKGLRPKPNPNAPDAYFGRVSFGAGVGRWQLIRLPLDRFKPSGNPNLADAKDIRIQIPANKAFDFYIDEIRLMRKDPATPQAGKATGRRR